MLWEHSKGVFVSFVRLQAELHLQSFVYLCVCIPLIGSLSPSHGLIKTCFNAYCRKGKVKFNDSFMYIIMVLGSWDKIDENTLNILRIWIFLLILSKALHSIFEL